MKTTIKTGICMIMLSFAISSCMKEELKIQDSEANKYYETEIFNSLHEKIYGSWQISEVSDRFGTKVTDFDYQQIEILPIGRFIFKSNGEVVNAGKVVVDKQADDILLVTFYSEDDLRRETDVQKYIEFINDGTMFFKAPCCYGKDYTFRRVR